MSGCANPHCPRFGQNHQGVGQSADHPVDVNPMFLVWLAVLAIVALLFIAALGSAGATADKYDGACTGREAVGRCADKTQPPEPQVLPATIPEPVAAEVPADIQGLK